MAKRNEAQMEYAEELMEHAADLHENGDGVAADLMLFSAQAVAAMNWHNEVERARRFVFADTDELDWR